MRKTIEQLELDLERKMKYSASLNLKINVLNERLKKFMLRDEHEKAIALLTQQYPPLFGLPYLHKPLKE